MADVKDVGLLKEAYCICHTGSPVAERIEARLREIAGPRTNHEGVLPENHTPGEWAGCAAYEALKDLGLLEEPMDWAKAEAELRECAGDWWIHGDTFGVNKWNEVGECPGGRRAFDAARDYGGGIRSRDLYNRIMSLRKR